MSQRENHVLVWKAAYGWRWKAIASNGKCVATCGGQHYNRRVDAMAAAGEWGPAGWPVVVQPTKGKR